jgi:hypothetical protein
MAVSSSLPSDRSERELGRALRRDRGFGGRGGQTVLGGLVSGDWAFLGRQLVPQVYEPLMDEAAGRRSPVPVVLASASE